MPRPSCTTIVLNASQSCESSVGSPRAILRSTSATYPAQNPQCHTRSWTDHPGTTPSSDRRSSGTLLNASTNADHAASSFWRSSSVVVMAGDPNPAPRHDALVGPAILRDLAERVDERGPRRVFFLEELFGRRHGGERYLVRRPIASKRRARAVD